MLKDKYSLTYSEGKQSVKTEKLHASERVKYEIYRAVKEALRSADTWKEFQNKLLKMGVEMEFKYKGNTNEVHGGRERGGTPAEKEEAQERKEFVN